MSRRPYPMYTSEQKSHMSHYYVIVRPTTTSDTTRNLFISSLLHDGETVFSPVLVVLSRTSNDIWLVTLTCDTTDWIFSLVRECLRFKVCNRQTLILNVTFSPVVSLDTWCRCLPSKRSKEVVTVSLHDKTSGANGEPSLKNTRVKTRLVPIHPGSSSPHDPTTDYRDSSR